MRGSCVHVICESCVLQLIRRSYTGLVDCPFCRQEVPEWIFVEPVRRAVRRIINSRGTGKNTQYKVVCRGGDISWEPAANLDQCPEKIREWVSWRNSRNQRRRRQKLRGEEPEPLEDRPIGESEKSESDDDEVIILN